MPRYEVVLFDADHTLFDFDRAEREALRQTLEEAGLTVVPVRVVALHDKGLHNPPAYPYGICKVFFLCEIVDGGVM